MHPVKIHPRIASCPVCGQSTLLGYTFDLPDHEIEYDDHFLPRAVGVGRTNGEPPADRLALFNHYLCPVDLFAYSGNIATSNGETRLEENVYGEFSRFLRGRRPEFLGARVRFFLAALVANGLPPSALARKDGTAEERQAAAGAWASLVATAGRESQTPASVYSAFRRLLDDHGWNPFEALLPEFYHNPPVMRAFLKLQLADILFLLRRSVERRPAPVAYPRLFDALGRLRNHLNQDRPRRPLPQGTTRRRTP